MRHAMLPVKCLCLPRRVRCAGFLLLSLLFPWPGMVSGAEAEKTIFLVSEPDRIIAANAATGQFFELALSAKERVEQRFVGSGVAVLITSQRFAGVGAYPSGWSTIRRRADEAFVSAEAVDYSAVVVTSDRVLTFNGKIGAWSFTDR